MAKDGAAAQAVTALDAGINPVSAALLGVTTGVGGGCWVTSSQTGTRSSSTPGTSTPSRPYWERP